VKLSKTSWIFLTVGIFVIVGISLILTRVQQTDQQNKLQADLTQARLKLAAIKVDELILQKGNLTRQIADFESQTQETKAILTSSKDSIDTSAAVLDEAQNQGVKIVSLTSPGLNYEMLEGNKCETLPLNIRVRGNILNVADFVRALSRVFPTGVIKSIQLNIEEINPSPTTLPSGDEDEQLDRAPVEVNDAGVAAGPPDPEGQLPQDANITINLVIYNYKGK
jgi:hypothetical protein